MCDGRRFQADGAATEKELLESWRLNRGTSTIKSPRDVDRDVDILNLTSGIIAYTQPIYDNCPEDRTCFAIFACLFMHGLRSHVEHV